MKPAKYYVDIFEAKLHAVMHEGADPELGPDIFLEQLFLECQIDVLADQIKPKGNA